MYCFLRVCDDAAWYPKWDEWPCNASCLSGEAVPVGMAREGHGVAGHHRLCGARCWCVPGQHREIPHLQGRAAC